MPLPFHQQVADLVNAVRGIQPYHDPSAVPGKPAPGMRISADVCQQISEAAARVEVAIESTKKHIPTVYVMGPTNAGKSTLLDVVRCLPMVGLVEVGKMMRAKYPPEHFQGQAAPKHTQAEAISMCLDSMVKHYQDGKRVAFVDGQPRDLEQVQTLCAIPNRRVFLILWASEEVRTGRAQRRDGSDPAKLELSLKRMRGDCVGLFDIMCHLQMRGEQVIVVDTGGVREASEDVTGAGDYTAWSTACMAAGVVGVIL